MTGIETVNDTRKLHDLGGYLAWWLAVPLHKLWHGSGDPDSWTLEEWRSNALDRPTDAHALAGAHLVRVTTWMSLGGAALLAMLLIGFSIDVLTPFEPPALVGDIFGMASVTGLLVAMVNGFKAGVVWYSSFVDRAYWRAADSGRRPTGIRLRLVMPSNWDVILMLPVAYALTIW